MPLLRTKQALLWLAPLCLYVAHVWLFRHYTVDDAYITFRYSRSLAEGMGPYFNPGEHVEGYTNFLLMLLLAGVAKLAGAAVLPAAAQLLSLVGGALAIVAAYELARRAIQDTDQAPLAGALAAGLLAAAPSFAVNSASGLETTLYAALVAWGVVLGEAGDRSRVWRGCGIAFAGALLTRPDGALIFAVYWSGRLTWSWTVPQGSGVRRGLYIDVMVVVAVFAAQLLFRHLAYDGELLPNTYYDKSGGLPGSAWGYIRDGAAAPFGGAVAASLAVMAACWLDRGRLRLMVVAAPAALGVLSPLLIGIDWMPGQRFVAPYLPLLSALVAVGWWRVLGRLRLSRPLAGVIAVALVALLWLAQAGWRTTLQDYVQLRAAGYRQGHLALARWLESQLRPGETVALMDIGIVGYELPDQDILDMSGLTDRTIAKSPGRFLDKRYDPAYVLDRKPRFLVLVFASKTEHPTAVPDSLDLQPGTPIDGRMYAAAGFRQHYLGRTTEEGEGWLDSVAATLGARRVFLHTLPDQYYFLAVYERHEGVS